MKQTQDPTPCFVPDSALLLIHNSFAFFPHPSRAVLGNEGYGQSTAIPPSFSCFFFSLLQCESIPQAAVLHKLHQHSSSPPGTHLYGQTAAVWVPHRTQVPQKNSSVVSSLMWSHLLPGSCSQVHSAWAAASLKGCLSAVLWVLAWAASRTDVCSAMVLHRLQGDSLCHHNALYGEPLFWHLDHCPPFLLHLPWCLQGCFSKT